LRFTVRRPASAEVSPCCHRPSGGDVACSVHVGVARPRAAGLALENRLALTVFGSDVPAHTAPLRRVRGRDLLDPTRGFLLQAHSEHAPTASANTPVQSAFLGNTGTWLLHRSPHRAGHRRHIKRLNADRVESTSYIRGDLFDPVLASVGLAGLEFGDCALGAGSPGGAALGARQALLQHPQSPDFTATQARSVQQFASRQGCGHRNAPVDTQHGAVGRAGNGFRCVGERHVPAAGPITGNAVGLHSVRYRPGQPKTDPADLGHPYPTEPAVQPLDVTRFDRDLPEALMHTGFAPRRAAMRSSEEVAHRLGKVPQRLLLHRLRACRQPIVFGPRRSQLRALLVVARCAATRLPVLLLLDGQVPHIPSVATMLGQHRRLLSGRKQPISRHPRNLTVTTDNTQKAEATSAPPVKARGYHPTTSR
jgi:hypothetical protein